MSHDLQKSFWFSAQETFMIIINVEKSCAASDFCGNHDTFFSELVSLMNRRLKRTAFIWKRTDFIKVFTVTFVQCNASFMKSINFCPQTFEWQPYHYSDEHIYCHLSPLTSLALFLVLSHILCQFVLYSSICKRHLFACLAACCSGSSAVTWNTCCGL